MRKLVQPTLGVLATIVGLPAFGQLQVDWRQTYSTFGPGVENYEHGTTCAVAPNGDLVWSSRHIVATGSPFPGSQEHSEVHRTSASGTSIWNLSLAPLSETFVERIDIDAAGDFYASGFAGTWGGSAEPLVVKISASGTLLWSRTVSGVFLALDWGVGGLDPSGNFTFIGVHDDGGAPTHFVRSYDTNGTVILDTLAFSTPLGVDGLRNMQPFPGGGFCAVGMSVTGMFVARLDFDGTVLWRRAVPQGPANTGFINSVVVDASGRIAAAGFEYDAAWNKRTVMALYDASGNLLLEHRGTFPGSSSLPHCQFAPDGSLWLVALEAASVDAPHHLALRRWKRDLTLAAQVTHPLRMARTLVGESGQLWVFSHGGSLHEIAPTGTINWSWAPPAPQSFDRYDRFLQAPDRSFIALGDYDASNGGLMDNDVVVLRIDATDLPRGYCVGTGGALGCAPHLEFEGAPRATATSGFVVHALPWPSHTAGRFLVGVGPAVAHPFFGGTLCVGAPRVRTTALLSGGNPVGAPDCSGALTLDYGAWASGALGGALLPGLQSAGTSVRLQAWSRDTGSATNALLSNALEFTVLF